MNQSQHARSLPLLGEQGLERLQNARVAVFGIGGVGGHLCEALARAGVGELHLFDKDTVSLSNINRQAVALHSTVGLAKVEVMKARIADINPDCRVIAHEVFYLPENADEYDLSEFDYIADAIDTVSAKVELICRAKAANVPIISAMGAGNKLDPSAFRVADLAKTQACPLARIMRRELGARGIRHLTVVYSEEKPRPSLLPSEHGKHTPASVSFVPPTMGLIMAGRIVCDLSGVSPE
ncbi:MAG: tRNA threonylcarbamoyladenosine dehydratase [Ruminococcaceae bacterium]|nr:tRNA threonylcarbamoyladenosine dehydratase [Oscillospiraceae bacterium]